MNLYLKNNYHEICDILQSLLQYYVIPLTELKQNYLLPFTRIQGNSSNEYEYDGGANYSWKSQVFILSFHINSINDVKVYWYLNGSMMRFLPKNMLNVWPNYFYNDDNLQNDINSINYKTIQKDWKLKITDNVFDKYYKELIPKKE